MFRRALLATLRLTALLLAMQLADTPIFCSDERAGGTGAESADYSAPAGELHASSQLDPSDQPCCFCPCHLTFEQERPIVLTASNEPHLLSAIPPIDSPTATPRTLDHPPKSLG